MHELSVAMGIVDRARRAAEEHGAAVVEELTVELGAATHVNPDQLRFCLEVATRETAVEGATITIETVEPLARCGCGWHGEPGGLEAAIGYAPDLRCPDCGGRTALERGRECRLASIEVPDGADGPPEEPTRRAERHDT